MTTDLTPAYTALLYSRLNQVMLRGNSDCYNLSFLLEHFYSTWGFSLKGEIFKNRIFCFLRDWISIQEIYKILPNDEIYIVLGFDLENIKKTQHIQTEELVNLILSFVVDDKIDKNGRQLVKFKQESCYTFVKDVLDHFGVSE